MGGEKAFLVHHRDAVRRRLRRVLKRDFLASPEHIARVRLSDPGNNLPQRGLARAVLSHQKMNFALIDGKVTVAQRRDAAISLLYILQLKEHFEMNHRTGGPESNLA